MPIATLLGFIFFFLGCLSIALLFLFTNRLCLYLICRRTLKKISQQLIDNKPLLFRYKDERTMKNLEELLSLVSHTSQLLKNHYHTSLTNLLSPFQLYAYVDECKERTCFYFQTLQKKQPTPSPLTHYKRAESWLRNSCYFCSQPILFSFWNKAGIHGEKGKRQVSCCYTCRNTLEKSHKVNTLCFVENETQQHWQECSSYQPQFLYWDINQKTHVKLIPKKQGRFLRLIRNQNTEKKG